MFAVFARFNPLITRTRVHSAVKEFQIQLISTVGVAIEKLQSKFTHKYETSNASKLSRIRGIPPIAGKILWAKQIERQVNTLMARMGNVLGRNWGQHLEGRQLRRSGDELLSKLDAKSFFRGWVTEWERDISNQATASNARLSSYPIIVVRKGSNNTLIAKVNFDEKYEQLFREIRYLKWLGFERDIPKTLTLSSEENLNRYPHAMALKSALRSYSAIREFVTPEIQPLVMPQIKSIRESISEAFGISNDGKRMSSSRRVRWDGKDIDEWVAGLMELVTLFEERVETLLRACEKIDSLLIVLSSVEYDRDKFMDAVQGIQKVVDELSLAGYSELKSWVKVVDKKMAEILSQRLESAIYAWCKAFQVNNNVEGESIEGNEEKKSNHRSTNTSIVNFPVITVEVLLRNQVITTQPSLPTIRSIFIKKFHDYISIICSLPRPTSGRFEVFESEGVSDRSVGAFNYVIQEISPSSIADAYSTIECYMGELSCFVEKWLAYQTLWNTRVLDVANIVGDKMDSWRTLLNETTEARDALEVSTTYSKFGPVLAKYGKVHSQVRNSSFTNPFFFKVH